MKTGQYAFWEYDQFPYVHGGTITKVEGELVETKEFGKNYYFKPVLIVSKEEGMDIIKKLEKLTHDRNIQLDSVRLSFNKLLKNIIDLGTDLKLVK